MTISRNVPPLFAILVALAGPAQAAVHACTARVATASDAAAKADWIMEGTVDMVATFPGEGMMVTLGATNVLKGKGANKGGSDTVNIGPDFPQAGAQFQGEAGRKMQGKRVRLFGTRHAAGAPRRAFFMQAGADAMPTVPPAGAPAVTRLYRDAAADPSGNGWHRAHSTEGRYTVDLPAPFQDMTAVMDDQPGYMVRTTDTAGRTFMAIREPAGIRPPMAGTLDTGLSRAGATARQFQGVTALTARNLAGPHLQQSIMFRVPGSTWMLAVSTPRALEEKDPTGEAALRERFFQSLVCD
jgi:hypothetical protein